MLIGTNMVVAVMLLAAGSLFGYVTWRFGQIKKISVPSIASAKKGQPAEPPGSPMTILMVGSDSRAGLTGQDAKQFGTGTAVAGRARTRSSSSASTRRPPRRPSCPSPGTCG